MWSLYTHQIKLWVWKINTHQIKIWVCKKKAGEEERHRDGFKGVLKHSVWMVKTLPPIYTWIGLWPPYYQSNSRRELQSSQPAPIHENCQGARQEKPRSGLYKDLVKGQPEGNPKNIGDDGHTQTVTTSTPNHLVIGAFSHGPLHMFSLPMNIHEWRRTRHIRLFIKAGKFKSREDTL